jgi:valyl-tRNA synthetase
MLARAEMVEAVAGRSLAGVAPGLELRVPLEGLVELDSFRVRTEKRIAELEKQIKTSQGKLGNAGFVDRAPREVVEEERRRLEDHAGQVERLREVLKQLA